jgi:hypothetical protein
MDAITGAVGSVTGAVTGDDANDLCPSLTWTQRLYGFVGMMVVSFLLSIISWLAMFRGKYTTFGVVFTLGSLCSIGSSLFLSGPTKQIKKMFEETRWIATAVFLVSMVLTLVAALWLKNPALCVIFCLIQYGAMIWYSLSYIPFARAAVKNIVGAAIA